MLVRIDISKDGLGPRNRHRTKFSRLPSFVTKLGYQLTSVSMFRNLAWLSTTSCHVWFQSQVAGYRRLTCLVNIRSYFCVKFEKLAKIHVLLKDEMAKKQKKIGSLGTIQPTGYHLRIPRLVPGDHWSPPSVAKYDCRLPLGTTFGYEGKLPLVTMVGYQD